MKNDTQTHAENPADNATAQHTPGPWYAYPEYSNGGEVHSAHGLICDASIGLNESREYRAAHRAESVANAELIASAPRLKSELAELLAMLTRVQEIFECGEDLSNVNFFGTEQNQIRALLARIEKSTKP